MGILYLMPADSQAIQVDALHREALAEERVHLWGRLSEMKQGERGHSSAARRVREITAKLNGHYADISSGTAGARAGAGGGLYEQKRHDRATLEVATETHEYFFDHLGRRLSERPKR